MFPERCGMRWKRCSSSSPVPAFYVFKHFSNVVSNIAASVVAAGMWQGSPCTIKVTRCLQADCSHMKCILCLHCGVSQRPHWASTAVSRTELPVSPLPSHPRDNVSPRPVTFLTMTLLVIRLKGTRWSEPYLCWHSEFPLFISFCLKGFQIAFPYLAYGDFHLCDRLILLSGIYKDLQYQCTPHAAQDFSQNKHW